MQTAGAGARANQVHDQVQNQSQDRGRGDGRGAGGLGRRRGQGRGLGESRGCRAYEAKDLAENTESPITNGRSRNNEIEVIEMEFVGITGIVLVRVVWVVRCVSLETPILSSIYTRTRLVMHVRG